MGSTTGAGGRGESTSPKRSRNPSPPRQDPQPESKVDADAKAEPPSAIDAETTKPLAPPPRPAQQQPSGNTPDYFSTNPGNASLSLEPNPFEQSFAGGAGPETPGGTKLPSVAALTSPSSLLPVGGVTPFPWGGGSLRTGPLSPAMLSGPTNDYFSSDHIRGSFPTPNESSLRTGLTPGGSGSMFPVVPSPNSAPSLFALAGNTAPTPGTLDFHRTALSAAKREQKSQAQTQPSVTSQPPPPQEMSNGIPPLKNETKPAPGPFDPHDNDAANGLFLLAQGRNGTQPHPQPQQQYPVIPPPQLHTTTAPPPVVPPVSTSPQMNGNGSIAGSSARGVSEALSAGSDESEIARPNTRAKGKRNSGGATNTRRKAEDSGKGPASKKAKINGGSHSMNGSFDDMDHSDDDMMRDHEGNGKTKMTDEEKRKNFLERNRVAALKCRQRKKQWLANLQNKVELFSSENDALTAQITQLREEVVNLKTLLLAHKDCPVTQQQGLHGAFLQQATMDSFNPQMNPYGMGAPLPNQPVITGARRYS